MCVCVCALACARVSVSVSVCARVRACACSVLLYICAFPYGCIDVAGVCISFTCSRGPPMRPLHILTWARTRTVQIAATQQFNSVHMATARLKAQAEAEAMAAIRAEEQVMGLTKHDHHLRECLRPHRVSYIRSQS